MRSTEDLHAPREVSPPSPRMCSQSPSQHTGGPTWPAPIPMSTSRSSAPAERVMFHGGLKAGWGRRGTQRHRSADSSRGDSPRSPMGPREVGEEGGCQSDGIWGLQGAVMMGKRDGGHGPGGQVASGGENKWGHGFSSRGCRDAALDPGGGAFHTPTPRPVKAKPCCFRPAGLVAGRWGPRHDLGQPMPLIAGRRSQGIGP